MMTAGPLQATEIKTIIGYFPIEIVTVDTINIKDKEVNTDSPSESHIIVEITGTYESNGFTNQDLGLEFVPLGDNTNLNTQVFTIQIRETKQTNAVIDVPSSIMATISSIQPFSFIFKIQPMGLPYGWKAMNWQFTIGDHANENDKIAQLNARLANTAKGVHWQVKHQIFTFDN